MRFALVLFLAACGDPCTFHVDVQLHAPDGGLGRVEVAPAFLADEDAGG